MRRTTLSGLCSEKCHYQHKMLHRRTGTGPRPSRSVITALLALALLGAACRTGSSQANTSTASSRPNASQPKASQPNAKQPNASQANAPTSFSATLAPFQLPVAVSRPVVVADGNKLVALGGLTAGDTSSSAILQVDPASGRTSQVGQLAQASHDAGGALLGGRLVVFGGGAASVHDTVQAFTPGTPGTPGTPAAQVVSHLPRPRADLSTTTANGVAYVVGGYDGTSADPAVLATSDARTFRTVAQLPHPVRYGAAAALGPYLWVFGGVSNGGTDNYPATSYIQRIDTRTGQATVAGTLPVSLSHAAAVVVDGTLLVAGGLVGGHASSTIWRLDPATASVVPAGTLPETVSMPGAAAIAGVGYLVGGENSAALRTVVELRPA